MFYKGNLSNFYPPDLLVFLSSSEQDGYFTVESPGALSITIKKGMVVDAFSVKGDNLLLRTLFLKKRITSQQIQVISKARKETSLSCRQVLEKLDFFPIASIEAELIQAIEEVIFQFFQKESGLFQFTDTPIDESDCVTRLFPDELLLDVTARVDGWHEYLHQLGDLNQLAVINPECREKPASRTEEVLANMAKKKKTLHQLISQAPFADYVAAKALVNCVRQQVFIVQSNSVSGKNIIVPSVFSQYKKYLRKILQAQTIRRKLEDILYFCKNYFDHIAVLSINRDLLEGAVCFSRNDNGMLQSEKVIKENVSLKQDPVILTVCDKGLAYFGKMQESVLFTELFGETAGGECGIIPFEAKDHQVKLLFAQTRHVPYKDQTPMQYLELLSWHISPEQTSAELPENFGQDKIKKIMSLADELPPMPHVAGKALEILNDPENSLQKLSEVLEQDPSLLAMIIKVSNSALYSTGQVITNLHTAVAKLGITIIRSLVLTAATRTLFPADNPKIKELSQPLWYHVKGCGLAARIIAKSVHYSDPEEAFVGGLLHDIGKLAILLYYPQEYEKIEQEVEKTKAASYLVEEQVLGFSHTDIGQMLTSKWHMPKVLQTCVHFHHVPEEASETYRQLAMIIHLADLQIHILENPVEINVESSWHSMEFLCDELQISTDQLQLITQDVKDSIRHIGSLDG
jgi:HD-like signal output (HDOD) protein